MDVEITMDKNLSNVLPAIKQRLSAADISGFKIGITGDDVKKRYWNGYDKERYTHISEIATGNSNAVIEAEKDLIEWCTNDTILKIKCNNIAEGGNGDVTDADKVYIVAKSSDVKFEDLSTAQNVNELWGTALFPENLLPDFHPVKLQNK